MMQRRIKRWYIYDDDGILNVQQPASPDRDEFGFLNCKSLPPSPQALTDDWISRSTTPNVRD